jgi:hypothetical protein
MLFWEKKRMNDIERTLKGPALSSVYLAADGAGSPHGPRDEDPRPDLGLGDMLEMGLESLLMHFRRGPAGRITPDDRKKDAEAQG